MKAEEDFEIFWEKTEGLSPEETQSFLSRLIPAAFPESFLFHLPGMEPEGGLAGFSFFDSSGAFAKAIVMETAGRRELEALLQAYLSFKQEAENLFTGRGSRIFQPGIETRLVLFARAFHTEFVQQLRFYRVPVSLISYVLIQGGGKKGILLRRVEDEANGFEERQSLLERVREEKGDFFFKDNELSLEEQRALERLHPLRRMPTTQESLGFHGKKEG